MRKRELKHKKMKNLKIIAVVAAAVFIASCGRERSGATGWEYNNPKNGGFQKVPYIDQETGPGLVFIQGGTFTMGRAEQDVMYDWNNVPRRVTVSSFYMDQFEVTNFYWCEYLYWVKRTYTTYPMVYKNALPDTNSWRSKLGFNEPYVEYYLRHPAYRDYPVVGVSWLQANDFCKWRTDRVNEFILIREGILNLNPFQEDDPFTTDAFMAGQYDNEINQLMPDLDPAKGAGGTKRKDLGQRIPRTADGILLPRYRLPTEAEWEFAYYGLIGNLQNEGSEVITDRRLYPWDGHWVRQDDQKFQGQIRANFVRGRGDYMGVAGQLNDNADITAPVMAYWPNDYGLYHMAGNVSEWVMDVYRPLSHEDFDEFRPFRGNVFKTKVLNNAGEIDDKNTITLYDVHGIKEYLNQFERIRYQRLTGNPYQPQENTDTNFFKSPYGTQINSHNRTSNPVENGLPPDQYYLSQNRRLDSLEKYVLYRVNDVINRAIDLKDKKYYIEASQLIQDEIFDGIFLDEALRDSLDYEYSLDIVPMLRSGISEFIVNTPGKLKWREVTAEENIKRRNYKHSDYIDHLDGDIDYSLNYDNEKYREDVNQGVRNVDIVMYQDEYEEVNLSGSQIKSNNDYGHTEWPSTLISDKTRVYKGGSWADRAYWLVGSNRRYLEEDMSSCTIGFRCAMHRVGSPYGLGKGGGRTSTR